MSAFTALIALFSCILFSSIASHTIFNNQDMDTCAGALSLKLYKIVSPDQQSASLQSISKSIISANHNGVSLVRDCDASRAEIEPIDLDAFLNVVQKGSYALVFDENANDEMESLMVELHRKLKGKKVHQRKILSMQDWEDDDEEDEEDLDIVRTLYVESYQDLDKMVSAMESAANEDAKTLQDAAEYELVQDIVPSANSTSTELYVNADIIQKGILFGGFIAILLVFFGFMHSLQTAEHIASNMNVEELQKKIQ